MVVNTVRARSTPIIPLSAHGIYLRPRQPSYPLLQACVVGGFFVAGTLEGGDVTNRAVFDDGIASLQNLPNNGRTGDVFAEGVVAVPPEVSLRTRTSAGQDKPRLRDILS